MALCHGPQIGIKTELLKEAAILEFLHQVPTRRTSCVNPAKQSSCIRCGVGDNGAGHEQSLPCRRCIGSAAHDEGVTFLINGQKPRDRSRYKFAEHLRTTSL